MFKFEEISKKVGQKVRVEGFVATTRIQSKVAFVVLESGSSKVQAVAFGSAKEQAKTLTQHSYAAVEGVVVEAKQAPGGYEIQAELVELISPCAYWPIAEESEIGARMEWPMARFRERKEAMIMMAQSELEFAMISHMRAIGFTGIHSPKLIGYPSESGAEVFEVKYFEQKAYLAQSPQQQKQIGAMAMGKIYEVGPVFRAEPSHGSRHAAEFISIDTEWEGAKSEIELVEMECEMLRSAMQQAISTLGSEFTEFYPKATMPGPVRIMTFRQAQEVLGLRGNESLSAEEERRLGAIMAEQGHELVALTQVPWEQRPFYHMKEVVGGDELTRSFELIYRGVEITTGAIREHRHEVLMAQLAEKGLTGKGMEFYLDSFKLGAPPHGGFGLGLSRLVMLFLGLPGIKEATFIHRGPGRLIP